MLSLIFTIFVALAICGFLYWFAGRFLPEPFKIVGVAATVLLAFVWILKILGLFGAPYRLNFPFNL
jgi:hypothetical protein